MIQYFTQYGPLTISNDIKGVKIEKVGKYIDNRIRFASYNTDDFDTEFDLSTCHITERQVYLNPMFNGTNLDLVTDRMKEDAINNHIRSLIANVPASEHTNEYSLKIANMQVRDYGARYGDCDDLRLINYLNKYIVLRFEDIGVWVNDDEMTIAVCFFRNPIVYSYSTDNIRNDIAVQMANSRSYAGPIL